MIDFEYIKMLLYFINPFNYVHGGFLGIIDIATFMVIPYLILRKMI